VTSLPEENKNGLSPTSARLHKFPLPGTPHIGVQVKVNPSVFYQTVHPPAPL
jgi:hypothetical protein